MKKNIPLVSIIAIVILLFLVLLCKNIINISVLTGKESSGTHFNLLTVGSIIGGFMFSGLGLLLSVSEKRLVKEFERASLMDRVYNNIIAGILSCGISIIMALIMIFKYANTPNNVVVTTAYIEITSLGIGIACFLASVIDLRFIINAVHKDSKVVPEEVLKEIRNKARKKEKSENNEEV